MRDVSANVVMNGIDKAIVAIDRRQCTFQEIPIISDTKEYLPLCDEGM